jgi:hypothetical protein
MEINASYEIVDGFEIDGVNAIGYGVCLDDENSTTPPASGTGTIHHAIGENNLVHDCGGGGFQWNYTEYLWIYNNVVHDNSQTNTNQMSGISIFEPAVAASFTHTAYDTALPFHIMTIKNLIWHNYMNSSVPANHTDGEGIIFDTWVNQTTAYTTPGLIYGNVICYNGGGGIQFDNASYITVANNSTYSNYLDLANTGTWRGEGNNWYSDSNNNTWINNIFMNVTSGTGINSSERGATGSLANNIGLNFEQSGAGNVATTNDSYPAALAVLNGATTPTETGNVHIAPAYTAVGTLPSSSTNTIPCNLRPTSGSLPAATAASYIPSGVTKIGAYGPGALQ